MPINPGEMRNPNLGWALSSLAGPVSNILSAIGRGAGGRARCLRRRPMRPHQFVGAFIGINVALAVFNLLPVPPLDGFGFSSACRRGQSRSALMPAAAVRTVHSAGRPVPAGDCRSYLDAFLAGCSEHRLPFSGGAGQVPITASRSSGTGLIGSSVGLALKAARPQTQVVGYDASGDNLRRAQQSRRSIDARSLRDALADADLVIISTPGRRHEGALRRDRRRCCRSGAGHGHRQHQGAGAAVGSRTAAERRALHRRPPDGGQDGDRADAADAKLFQGAVWCLVPLPTAPRDAIDEAVRLVESLGASPYFLDPDEHDGLVASVSHLPYLMSGGVDRAPGATSASWRETASLAAGGFAYATHLTDSDPQMFADIVRTNRDNIGAAARPVHGRAAGAARGDRRGQRLN